MKLFQVNLVIDGKPIIHQITCYSIDRIKEYYVNWNKVYGPGGKKNKLTSIQKIEVGEIKSIEIPIDTPFKTTIYKRNVCPKNRCIYCGQGDCCL